MTFAGRLPAPGPREGLAERQLKAVDFKEIAFDETA